MTLKEILDLKEQGYSLDEIERINEILESTGTEDDPKPEDDPEPDPEKDSSDHEEAGTDSPADDDQPNSGEPDYKKMYEDLKEKTEKDAARNDLSGEDEKQLEIQDAVAAFFKSKFS